MDAAGPMIEFSCIYCGQLIRVEEKLARQRILCPACGHSVLVRARAPGDALKSVSRDSEEARKEDDHWAGKSDQEIVDGLLSRTFTKQERRERAIRILLSPLIPRYDDLTLFALSLAFVLLWLINRDLRRDLVTAFTQEPFDDLTVSLAIAVIGMGLSLLNVFWTREKSDFERGAMLMFAVAVTGGIGVYSGWLMLQQSRGWLVVFPAWNLINGGLLLILFRLGLVDTECITGEKAGFVQVILTVVMVTVLLTVCQRYFELHWSVTFSIAAAYTLSLHNALRDVFGGHKPLPKPGAVADETK